jgi:hypothetical protein
VSENLQKLVGVVVMAVLVVVGVAVSSGDDTEYTRNLALPGASPLLEGQGDLTFELLDGRIAALNERIGTVEQFLSKDQFVELTSVAQNLVDEIRGLRSASQELLSGMGETEQRVSDAEGRVSDAEGRVSDAELRLAQAYQFARNQIDELEAEQGWVQTLDLMCQQQLSAWGRTATRADAIWDKGGRVLNVDVAGFWACRYDNLNIPELAGIQLSERVGVCLPGGQPRVIEGVRTRGIGFEAIFADSINRWVFQFNPDIEDGRFHEADFLFDAGCQ